MDDQFLRLAVSLLGGSLILGGIGLLLDGVMSWMSGKPRSPEILESNDLKLGEVSRETGDDCNAAGSADGRTGGKTVAGFDPVGPPNAGCRDDSGSDPDREIRAVER